MHARGGQNQHGFRRSAGRGFASRGRSAEHGFGSCGRSAEHGFTLVELMVVMALIALASVVVVLAWPDPRGRVNDDAARFAAHVRAARDMAMIEGRSVSLWVTVGGYGFDRRDRDGWQPIAEKPFRVARWEHGVRPVVTAADGRERVIFDPTGFASVPLSLDLRRGDAHARVVIGSDGTVRVDG